MRRGQKLEAAGNWSGAYLAYSEAVAAKPNNPSPEAVEARDRAADVLVEQDATAGREALAADDYEGAMAAVERITDIDPDRPEAFQLKLAIESKMSAAYLRLWSAGEVAKAYAHAVRIKKLFPDAKILGGAFTQLRDAVEKEAETLLAKGQHAEALATIRVIPAHEPDQAERVAPIEQKIIAAWADALVKEAKRMQSARKPGAASLLYARAYEVAARGPDLEQSRTIATALAPAGRLRVKLEVTGAQSRAASMRALLTGGLSVLPDVTVVTSGASDLVVRATLGATKCTETDVPSAAVAAIGGGEVDDEEAAAQAEQEQVDAEAAAAADEAAQQAKELAAAEEILRAVEDKLASAEGALDEAEGALDELETQRDTTQARLEELETTLDDQRAEGATPAVLAETERQIAEVEARVASYDDQVRAQEETVANADALVSTLESDREAADAEVERLGGGTETATAKRGSKKPKEVAVAGDDGQPGDTGADPVATDTSDYVRYELHTWTRGCTAPATVSLRPAFQTDVGPPREVAPHSETVDKEHAALPEAGLAADPKAYALSDADLVAKGDATTAAEVATWVTTAADTFFRDRAAQALASAKTDPKGASTAIVSLYVGAPARVDPPTAEQFATHAREVYGLTSLELVRTPPPAMATAPVAEDAEPQDE
jgi:hypothetical protein